MEMMGLHNLKINKTAKTKKRRVGRGTASGRGNYSGRGMKGQKSRSGGKSGLKLRGVKGYLQRIPKTRGFRSLVPKKEEINLFDLDKNFVDGDVVMPKDLLNKGLIKTIKNGVKVLGTGKITKKLEVKVNAFSKTAEKAIIKAGGKVVVLVKKSKNVTDNQKNIEKKKIARKK